MKNLNLKDKKGIIFLSIICFAAIITGILLLLNRKDSSDARDILDQITGRPAGTEGNGQGEYYEYTEKSWKENDRLFTEEELKQAYPGKKVLVWLMDEVVLDGITAEWQTVFNDRLIEKGSDFVLRWAGLPPFYEYPAALQSYFSDASKQADLFYTGSLFESWQPGGISDSYMDAYKNGWLMPLENYLNSQEGEGLRGAFSPQFWDRMRIEGEIYGISAGNSIASGGAVLIRDDVYEKVEPYISSDIKELRPALETLKAKGDFYPLFPADSLENTASVLGYQLIAPGIAMESQRGAFLLFEDEEFMEYIKNIYAYYKAGYINPDLSAGLENPYAVYYSSYDPELVSNYGYTGRLLTEISAGSEKTATGVYSGAEYPDEAMKLLSWLYSDKELADALAYGMRGIDHEISDGKIVFSASAGSSNLLRWYAQLYYFCSPLSMDEPEKNQKYINYIYDLEVSPMAGFHFYSQSLSEKIDASAEIIQNFLMPLVIYEGEDESQQKLKQEFRQSSGLLTGHYENDPIERLLELSSLLKQEGIMDIIEEINRQYDEWKPLYQRLGTEG